MNKRLHSQRDLPLYVQHESCSKRAKNSSFYSICSPGESGFEASLQGSQQTVGTVASLSQSSSVNQEATGGFGTRAKILSKKQFRFASQEERPAEENFGTFEVFSNDEEDSAQEERYAKAQWENYNRTEHDNTFMHNEGSSSLDCVQEQVRILTQGDLEELASCEKFMPAAGMHSSACHQKQKQFQSSDRKAPKLAANDKIDGGLFELGGREDSLQSEEQLLPFFQRLASSDQLESDWVQKRQSRGENITSFLQENQILEQLILASKNVSLSQDIIISDQDRRSLIQWIQQLCQCYSIQRQTIYLIISIFDSVIHSPSFAIDLSSNDDLEALTLMSIHIGTKVEEEQPPSIKRLVEHSSKTNSFERLFQVEKRILETIQWKVSKPNIETWGTFLLSLLCHNCSTSPKQTRIQKTLSSPQFAEAYWKVCDQLCFDSSLLNNFNSMYLSFSILTLAILSQIPDFFRNFSEIGSCSQLLQALTFGEEEVRGELAALAKQAMHQPLEAFELVQQTDVVLRLLLNYKGLFQDIQLIDV